MLLPITCCHQAIGLVSGLQKAVACQNRMHVKLPLSAYQPGNLWHQGLPSGLEDQAAPEKRKISFGEEKIQSQVSRLCD